MAEAAPLLKFTLQKSASQIEEENIAEILNLAREIGAQNIIISSSVIQFFNPIGALGTLQRNQISSNHFETSKYLTIHQDRQYPLININPDQSYYGCMLIKGSQSGGAYVLQPNNTFKHIRIAKEIIKHNEFCGYASLAGRTPTIITPDVFCIKDVSEVEDVLQFCSARGFSGSYIEKFARFIQSSTRNYRWTNHIETKKRIQQLTKR
jgi:hypothetical protein